MYKKQKGNVNGNKDSQHLSRGINRFWKWIRQFSENIWTLTDDRMCWSL